MSADQVNGVAPRAAVAPIATTIENGDEFAAIAGELAKHAGLPTVITADALTAMLGGAIPLLFAADAAHDVNLLRGTFAEPVIAQCERNAGCLLGHRPLSASVRLIGAPIVDGHPALRAHVTVALEASDSEPCAERQTWDLAPQAKVMVGAPSCPNCGAPIADGALICEHCHTDVRSLVTVPLVVSRLEIY